MNKTIVLILLFLISLKTFSQNNQAYIPGYIYKIKIQTKDKKRKENIPSVLIEGFIENKRVITTYSNLDGEQISNYALTNYLRIV